MDTSNLDLERVERSFDPSKRAPPSDRGEARQIVSGMMKMLPSREAQRLRTIAWWVDGKTTDLDTTQDRIYCALATAAEMLNTTPIQLVEHIAQQGTCVGTLMLQSGERK